MVDGRWKMEDGRWKLEIKQIQTISNDIKLFQIAKKILSEILKGFGFNLY